MNKLVQMGAQYGANQLGIQDNPLVKVGLAALDPIGTAIKAFAPSVNEALGAAPGTAEAVVNPKGFAKGLAKDIGKDYLKDREEIPEEDRSFASADSGSSDYDSGGKYYDTEGLSTTAMKRGGKVKSAAKSTVSKASRRADGIAQRGKTRGRMR
jgi:hypothetical protein